MDLKVSQIKTDGGTQPRATINRSVVKDYAADMLRGDDLSAVDVFYDGEVYWLADGFHRIEAAKLCDRQEIAVSIKQGTQRDAILYSVGANATHGFRRSNEDKRRAVKKLLDDSEWSQWSDNEIARRCKVSHTFVSNLRKDFTCNVASEKCKYRTKHGTITTMKTANIGSNHTDKPETPDKVESSDRQQKMWVTSEDLDEKKSKSVFNTTTEKIDWAKWSWNPVTGCLGPHGSPCEYCYARDIAERFYTQFPKGKRFQPHFYPERLLAPQNTRIPENRKEEQGIHNVFVCSMSDLFGEWVKQNWIDAVLKAVKQSPQWNFLFLTKNPKRLTTIEFPENAWVGTTVDIQARVKDAFDAFKQVNATVKFVSCEPLSEKLTFTSLEMFDWVIIGGRSKNTNLPAMQPKWEWVESLLLQARASNCKVYFKPNLTVTPKEYPEEK